MIDLVQEVEMWRNCGHLQTYNFSRGTVPGMVGPYRGRYGGTLLPYRTFKMLSRIWPLTSLFGRFIS